MSEENVSRRELALELKSMRNEMRVLMLTGIVVLKFQLPTSVTIGAISLVAGKAVWSAVVARFGA